MTRPFLSRFFAVGIAAAILVSSPSFAATFIVPDDQELVGKSAAIVTGVVIDSVGQRRADGQIETIYNVRIEKSLKGTFERGEVVQVASPGGRVEKRWSAVIGAAHFQPEDKVLLFLRQHRGKWTPTDMTLGKFRFVTSTGGQSLLVRDAEDIVGFDKQMRTHVERVRREATFLQFIEETVRGREAEADYFVPPGETVALPAEEKTGRFDVATNDTFSPRSYAIHFNFGLYPGRWPEARMTSAITRPFFKNSAQNASGLGDGGVAMITNSLNAWNNDCFSYANFPYGGTNSLLKNDADFVNTVIWNDPGDDIPGVWGGSGVIATAYMSGDDLHTFNAENDWVTMSDSDVVVQAGLTGAEAFVATAMTHEIGHGIGFRHSDTHFDGTGCQGTDECSSSAIMKASVSTHHNFTLQPWDQNAVRALYPIADQCSTPVPAAPTGLSATATSTASVSVTWNAVTGATNYKVFRREAAGSFVEVGQSATTAFTNSTGLSADTAYLYMVRASNAGGDSTDSNIDLTTTSVFTDSSLVAGIVVKPAHFNELRTAVNAVRTLAGLSTFSFTVPPPAATVTIRKAHVDDLRTNLAAARASLGLSALTLTDPTITAGTTPPKAVHITELRNGVL